MPSTNSRAMSCSFKFRVTLTVYPQPGSLPTTLANLGTAALDSSRRPVSSQKASSMSSCTEGPRASSKCACSGQCGASF
jgi:hypothetical protein